MVVLILFWKMSGLDVAFCLCFCCEGQAKQSRNIAMALTSHLGHLQVQSEVHNDQRYITNSDLDAVSQKRWENE